MLIGCVCAYNEAGLIGGAIESLFAVGCDRVIVVDGQWQGFAPGEPYHSTDGTQQIAAELGAQVIDPVGQAWSSQVEARNQYLVGELGDWYLVCDADERCHGTLPPLNDDSNSYWVELKGSVGSGPISGTRLFRHAGQTIRYYQRHYLIYVDGAIMAPPTLTAYAFCIEGLDRQDPQRDNRKAAYYPVETIRERGGDINQPRPIMQAIPTVDLGALRYTGAGAWLPGIPARDLSAWETDLHNAALVANLASPRPLYELTTLPAVTPDQPKPRRNRRKEQDNG